ncbi:D-lactate dehydrogenase [soil metagenome]
MNAIVFSTKPFEIEFLNKANKGHDLTFTASQLNQSNVSRANGYDAVVLFSNDIANREVMQKLSEARVKYIVTRSAGHDHIDLEAANDFHIEVANVPAYSPYSVAEHAILLMLSLSRRLIKSNDQFRENNFLLNDLIGTELHSCTVGVIGTGKIGETVIKILNGFGCRIIAHDIVRNKELEDKLDVKYCSLDTLLENSDIVTIHVPLNNQTKHLLDESKFQKMKKGSIIINTSRGGVINTNDLLLALEEKHVAYAGLDVFENEKPLYFKDHSGEEIKDDMFNKLKSLPNVLMTAHQAFLTETALKDIAETTILNLDYFERRETNPNLII